MSQLSDEGSFGSWVGGVGGSVHQEENRDGGTRGKDINIPVISILYAIILKPPFLLFTYLRMSHFTAATCFIWLFSRIVYLASIC